MLAMNDLASVNIPLGKKIAETREIIPPRIHEYFLKLSFLAKIGLIMNNKNKNIITLNTTCAVCSVSKA